MKKPVRFFIVCVMIFLPIIAFAVELESLKAIKIIGTDELKRLYDAKADFLLINTLSPIEFAEERIKGSVNIPFMHLKSGAAKLPDDKSKMLIFYCKGPK